METGNVPENFGFSFTIYVFLHVVPKLLIDKVNHFGLLVYETLFTSLTAKISFHLFLFPVQTS